MKILVAEDDALTRSILNKALKKLGHQTFLASNGLEAWEIVLAEDLDVIISDWLMPGLDGPELCTRVRALTDRTYIYFILLTSLTGREHFIEGMTAGADDYLNKPPDFEELQVRLTSASRVTSLHSRLAAQADELAKLNSQLSEEVEIARRIQTALLPRDLTIEKFELTMEMVTATQVGGDLIDYLPQPDGKFWLAVGDVTGHGLTSGLVMMMAQTIFNTLVREHADASPARILELLNNVLFHNVQGRMNNDNYMTLQVMRYLGEGRFVAAGMHLDILVYRHATGSVERIDVPGIWTGMMEDVAAMTSDYEFFVAPQDIVLLYTDGLIEARNTAREQFDMERLEQALVRYAPLPVAEIKRSILQEVIMWETEQMDDISLIVLRRLA